MIDLRDSATEAFTELFQRAPDGIWSAPGRVNLIGEHTDYNEGFVLPFAINRRTVAAMGVRTDRMLRVASAFADEMVEVDLDALVPVSLAPETRAPETRAPETRAPETLKGWSAYPLGVVWALGQFGADLDSLPGVDLYIDTDVPVGAGLSSSAAIECSVAVALNDVWQLNMDRGVLASVGQRAENVAVGAPTGIMDQTASLMGQSGAAVFLDCRSLDSEIIQLDLEAAGLGILVIDTAKSHNLADSGYADRRESCERAASILGLGSLRELTVDGLPHARELLDDVTFRRARHVVTENQRVLDTVRTLREQGPGRIGALLDASHSSMRDDFEISTPELDLAVETASANGALGARMTGGGFGGAAIALIPSETMSRLRVAIDGAFAEHGYQQPDIFMVTASHGAQRDR